MLETVRTVIFINTWIALFLASDGFLIDGNTQPVSTDGSVLTDKHYNFLLQFIFQERQSRLQEETKLQQQLAAIQSDLTAKIQELEKCVCPGKDQVISMDNKTQMLEDKLDKITKNYETMQMQFNSLHLEHLATLNKSSQLEKEIFGLNQLKVVSDAQTILNLQNSTNHLEKEIQKTNSKQAALESDANARKQDFLALFQKVKTSEMDLQSSNSSIHDTLSTLSGNITSLNAVLKSNSKSVESALGVLLGNIINLNSSLNSNNRNIQSKLSTLSGDIRSINITIDSNKRSIQNTKDIISNRVVLSAWTGGATVSLRHTVPFTTIRTSNGINDLTSMRNEGKFTCEKTGYYLITFFIATNAASGEMCIYVNSDIKACASKHADSNYQTHTAIYLDYLKVNDIVDVKVVSSGSLNVLSTFDSIFSILQVV